MAVSTIDTTHANWAGVVDIYKAKTPTFLQSLFAVKPGWVSNVEKILLDVVVNSETAASPQQVDGEGNKVEFGKSTQVEIVPPEYHDYYTLTRRDVAQRQPGQLATDSLDIDANKVAMIGKRNGEMMKRFRRGYEVQAATILTTGQFTAKGVNYDFQQPASLRQTVSTNWGEAGAKPYDDLETIGDTVRTESGHEVSDFIFGSAAFGHFIKSEETYKRLVMTQPGMFADPDLKSRDGAKLFGMYLIGTSRVRVWVYQATYQDESDKSRHPYLDPNKVIAVSEEAELIRQAASFETLLEPDPRVEEYSPGMVIDDAEGFAFSQTAKVEGQNALRIDIVSRIILNPIEVSSFACLTTQL